MALLECWQRSRLAQQIQLCSLSVGASRHLPNTTHTRYPPAPSTPPVILPQAAPEAAILVLHACGHNPTGVDVSREQWAGLLAVAQRKRFLVLWDVAYQVRLVCTMGAAEEQGACSAAHGLQAQLLPLRRTAVRTTYHGLHAAQLQTSLFTCLVP